MTVASDASPLVNLARIDRMDLLHQLYGQVLIPEAVFEEVVVEGRGQPGADAVRAADWIRTRSIDNEPLARSLRQTLDAGEAEAIVLALEENGLLLMDERLGRASARHLDLSCIGLVGVALEAKQHGFIRRVKPFLDALREQAGFYLGDALYQRVLRDENEASDI